MSTYRSAKKSLFVVPFLLMATAAKANAADTVTLDKVVGLVDKSPRIEKTQSAEVEGKWKSREAMSSFLPTVTLGASRLLDKKYALTNINFGGNPAIVPQIIPTTTYTLGAQWLLFDGLANVDRYQAAELASDASKKENSWAKFQTTRDAILLFYRAVAAQTLKEVAQQSLKTLEEHKNDVELFKKSGISTKFDVLRVDVQASEARSEVLNAEDNTQIAKLRLGELLGQDYTTSDVQGQLPVLKPDLIANFKASSQDVEQRGDLQAMSDRVTATAKSANASGKYWVPKVSAVAQFQQYNNIDDSWDSEKLRNAYSIGLQAAWTFDGVIGPYARDRQAAEQKVQAETTLRMQKMKASNDIEFFRRRYLYFCTVYLSREDDIGKATESVRLAKEGRKAGIRTNTDLLDAELELFRARAGRVNAQIGAIEALLNLESATGKEFYKFN